MPKPSTLYEFEAIGTHWWLEDLEGKGFSKRLQRELQDYTEGFDKRYSRFRDDSLVAEIAREGVLYNPPAEMLELLAYGERIRLDTEGAFSVLVGNDLQRLGYGTLSNMLLASSQAPELLWDDDTIRVAKGTILEFGGMGKGWLIDKYSQILRKHHKRQFIVNGGGDIYCQSKEPVAFALEHPYDTTLKIGEVRIKNGAIGASSTLKRVWGDERETFHHIIDPKTGKPSRSKVVATFVLAENALTADTFATVLIVRPDLEEKLARQYNLQTLVIKQDQLKI